MEPAAPAFLCAVGAFVAAPPLPSLKGAWLSPKQGSGVVRSRRWGVLPLASQLEVEDADEDVDNLLRVTPVPTREDMLAWAKQTDKRIAAGELPPFGSGGSVGTSRETGSLLSDREKMQLETVSELLSKRRQQGSSLSEQEQTALRSAIEGVSASVAGDDDSSFEKRLSGRESGVIGVGTGVDGGSKVAESEMVHNPIYGSREVRDKVYLYAWSLMKNKQEEAERRQR